MHRVVRVVEATVAGVVAAALVAAAAKRLVRPVDWSGLDGQPQPPAWDAGWWGHYDR